MSTSIGTVEGYLKLTDDFTVVLDRAMSALQKASGSMAANLNTMNAAMDSTGRMAKKMGNEVDASAKKVQASTNVIKEARAAYAASAIAIGFFVREVVQAQQASDRMFNTMLAATGNAKQAGEELGFARMEANRLGLEFASSAQQFAKLAAASKGTGISMDTVRKGFTAVSEASTAMGLNAETASGAMNAIVQMFSKGTIQAEEIRGQLADRLPQAFNILARSMGVTTAELNKLLEQGKVLSNDRTMSAFFDEMRATFSGGVEAGARSFNAELNRLKNTLFDIFNSIAQSSSLTSMIRSFNELATAIKSVMDVGGDTFFENLGEAIQESAGFIANLIALYGELRTLIGQVTMADATGIKPEDIGIMQSFTLAFKAFNEIAAEAKSKYKEFAEETKKENKAVEESFFSLSGSVSSFGAAFAAARGQLAGGGSEPKFVGPPKPTIEDIKARNDAYVTSFRETLAKLLKETNAYSKKTDKAFDLADKLKNEKRELEIFNKILSETSGDFELAKRISQSYFDVLKAGLDPQVGWGKALFESARALDEERERLDDAKDALKEYFEGIKYQMELKDAYEKAQEKAAAAEKERMDEAIARAKVNIDQLTEQVDAEMTLAHARMQGSDAVREASKELEIQRAIIQTIGDTVPMGSAAYKEMAEQIRAILEPLLDFNNAQEKANEEWKRWSDTIRSIDWGSDKMNDAADGIAGIIDNMNELRQLSFKLNNETGQMWAGMIQGVGQVLEAFGAFQESAGGFGGRGEGNYAAEGAAVGAIVGAIVGAFTMVGPQAGAAIGSAAGGMLGGAIKKGAEESLGSLTIDMSGFQTQVTKAEGALGTAMSGLGEDIARNFEQILGAIGGFAESLPQVDMKIRDGVISLTVGAVRARFKEMDDAIAFAVKELLNQGEISGLDSMIRTALQNTNASDLDQLASDLDAVMKVLGFGMTDGGKAIQTFTRELDVLRAQMMRLLGTGEELARALGNIATEEANRWQELRDQITGHQKTNAELRAEKEREAAIFNAEKALRIADLNVRLQELQAQAQIAQSRAGIFMESVRLGKNILEREAGIYETRLRVEAEYANGLASITQQIAAITQLIGALAAIPDIKPGEIKLPGNKGKGVGAGQSMEDRISAAFGVLGLSSLELEERLKTLADALKLLRTQGELTKEQLVELGSNMFMDILGQMAQVIDDSETLRMLEEARYDAQKINWMIEIERLKLLGVLNEEQYQKLLGYLNALPPDLPGGEDSSAADDAVEKARKIEEIIDSLGSPLESLRDSFAQQADAIWRLRRGLIDGSISADRFAEIMAEIADQAAMSVMGMAADILETMGRGEEAARMKYELEKLAFKIKVMELKMSLEHYLKLNLINQEMYDAMMKIVADAEKFKWPPFVYDGGHTGGGGGGHHEEEQDPIEKALLDAIERLRNAFDNYTDFLRSLEAGPLSGATMKDQFLASQEEYFRILGLAQGGDLDAIEQLPEIAQHYLEMASQFLDPASAAYQQLLAMVQLQVGALAGEIEDILNAVPDQMSGVESRLDTIIEIQEAWDHVWGSGFPGWDVLLRGTTGGGYGSQAQQGYSLNPFNNGFFAGGMSSTIAPSLSSTQNAIVVTAPDTDRELSNIKRTLIDGFGNMTESVDDQTEALRFESFIQQSPPAVRSARSPYSFKG